MVMISILTGFSVLFLLQKSDAYHNSIVNGQN